jgi:16S rRNA (uracil1498-N3)-methyltransferase
MKTPRYFVGLDLSPSLAGQTIELTVAASHHAVRVARLAVGDALTLFSGAGGEYAATLVRVDRNGAAARVDAFDPVERESPLQVTLAQAVAANDAMDYAVRKAVELGVAAIQPLVTSRSAPLPDGERGERRLGHWRNIAIAACEQCGRNRIPPIASPLPLAAWLECWRGKGIVLVPGSTTSLAALPGVVAPVAVAIGPEGGFAERETAAARASGFDAVGLGPRVLRTETAAATTLAALQLLWGDLQ